MPWKGKSFGWGTPAPYLDYLPVAQDATINVLRKIDEHFQSGEALGGTIEVSINYIESPSVELVAALMFQAYNTDAKMKRKVANVPKPDPRKSKAKFKLWKYRFKQAAVAVPRPPEDFVEACAQLAQQPYDYEDNWKLAGQLTQQLGPTHVPQLLAGMVHPPGVPAGIEPWTWLQRAQLAAAQMAANIEMKHRVPMQNSALLEITDGPIDWVIDAAVIALTQRARLEPRCAPLLCEQLFTIIERLPEEGYWSPLETCLQNILLLPDIPQDVCEEVQQTLAAIHADA